MCVCVDGWVSYLEGYGPTCAYRLGEFIHSLSGTDILLKLGKGTLS